MARATTKRQKQKNGENPAFVHAPLAYPSTVGCPIKADTVTARRIRSNVGAQNSSAGGIVLAALLGGERVRDQQAGRHRTPVSWGSARVSPGGRALSPALLSQLATQKYPLRRQLPLRGCCGISSDAAGEGPTALRAEPGSSRSMEPLRAERGRARWSKIRVRTAAR